MGEKRHHRNKWCCMRYWIFFTHIFIGIDPDVNSIRFGLKSIFHAIQLQYFYVRTLNPQKSIRKRKRTTKQITTAWEQAHSILVSNQMSQLFQCVMACCVWESAWVSCSLPLCVLCYEASNTFRYIFLTNYAYNHLNRHNVHSLDHTLSL